MTHVQLRSIRLSTMVRTIDATMLKRQPDVLMRTGMGGCGADGTRP